MFRGLNLQSFSHPCSLISCKFLQCFQIYKAQSSQSKFNCDKQWRAFKNTASHFTAWNVCESFVSKQWFRAHIKLPKSHEFINKSLCHNSFKIFRNFNGPPLCEPMNQCLYRFDLIPDKFYLHLPCFEQQAPLVCCFKCFETVNHISKHFI